MKISIVIPNYNGEEILKKNLPVLLKSVKNYKGGEVEIIISDDCSEDGSIGVIEEFLINNQNLILLRSDKNKGFSSNVNKGVMIAKGEILVLLNTDVIANDVFLKPLIDHFSDDSVFAVGCLNESVESEKIVLRGRGIGKWEKGFLVHSAGNLDKDNTLWISGGSGAFRKKIWDKLGGLDELYDPFYWEDIDISYRAQRAGYKTLFEKKSIVRHEHDRGAIKSRYTAIQVKRIAYRNQFIFVWKNADVTRLIMHLIWLPYHIANGLRGDFRLILGFFDALIRIPKIFHSRTKSRKLFTVSDDEILRNYES
jgi:GT2 family glycosyltransferase